MRFFTPFPLTSDPFLDNDFVESCPNAAAGRHLK